MQSKLAWAWSELWNMATGSSQAGATTNVQDTRRKPTLKELVIELREVTNVHGLGIQLDVPSANLREFEANYPRDLERQRIEVATCWLQIQVGASWHLVVEALHNNGDVSLAARVQKKYLPELSGGDDEVVPQQRCVASEQSAEHKQPTSHQEDYPITDPQQAQIHQFLASCQFGRLDEVRCLTESEAIDLGNKELGSLAMMLAACFGHVDVVEYLIDQKATMTKENYETALREAALRGHTAVVEILAKIQASKKGTEKSTSDLNSAQGASPNHEVGDLQMKDQEIAHVTEESLCTSQQNGGTNVLISQFLTCCEQGLIEEVTNLVELLEIDVNTSNENGQTGLMLAAKNGNEEVVKFLLSKGVNVLQKDNDGHISADLASATEHWGIYQLLADAIPSSPSEVSEQENTVTQVEEKPKVLRHVYLSRKPLSLDWEPLIDFPEQMSQGYAVYVKGHVYVGGGKYGHVPKLSSTVNLAVLGDLEEERTVFQYDVRNDTWCTLPRVSVCWFAMTNLENELVLIGGAIPKRKFWDISYSKELAVWDEQRHNWSNPLPPMHVARMKAMAVGYGQFLAVAGGKNTETLCSTEIFDKTSGQWMTAADLKEQIHYASSVLHQGMWYLIGGVEQGTSVYYTSIDELIQHALAEDSKSSQWMSLPDTPVEQAACAVIGGALVAIGGCKKWPTGANDVYEYWPEWKMWKRVWKSLPAACSTSVVASLPDDELLVIGGNNNLQFGHNFVVRGTIMDIND